MALSSNALCAKAKAMYGYRIGEQGYSDLCRKQTLGEMVTYLKSQTKYCGVLQDVNVRNVHRRQLEAALSKEYFERCARLMKYAPKKHHDFYNQEVIGIEVQLIVDKVVSIKEKDQASFSLEIPDYLASKMSFNIYGLINVDNYKEYLSLQCDSALRNIVRIYPYDVASNIDTTGDGLADEGSLRGSSETVASRIRDEIQSKVVDAGLEIVEARITYLAYAPEIASVMLQRQQASAIIDARKMIVDGAVGMVEMALERLNEKQVVELDEERKAAMVSNLLVVLCGNRDAQPVVNSGSLY